MSETRYQVGTDESKVVKYQVQDNVNNDKLVRYQVQGIGGGSAPVLESLNVTANGTYTPPEYIDGYNQVDVDVPITLPVTGNIIDYDFTVEDPNIDKVSNYHIQPIIVNNSNYHTSYDENGAYCKSTYAQCLTGISLNDYGYDYDIIIKLGEMATGENQNYTAQYNFICQFNRNIQGLYWDSSTNNWAFRSRTRTSSSLRNANLGFTDINDLDNAEIRLHLTKAGDSINYYVDVYVNNVLVVNDAQIDSERGATTMLLWGYDNKALTYSYIKSIEVRRTEVI